MLTVVELKCWICLFDIQETYFFLRDHLEDKKTLKDNCMPLRGLFRPHLRCLNTVCVRLRFVVLTWIRARPKLKALRKTNMVPVQRSFHFVQWRICKRFFFRLNKHTVCYVWKRLFFNVSGSAIGKHPAFLGLFVWIEKDRSRTLSKATHVRTTRKLWLHGLLEMHWFLRSRSLEFNEIR